MGTMLKSANPFSSGNSKSDAAVKGVDGAEYAANLVITPVGVAAAFGAGLAGTTAAFTLGGGILGIAAMIGLARSLYSNRDGAHKTLHPYVWSFLDDRVPRHIPKSNTGVNVNAELKKLGAAAYTLVTGGQRQAAEQVQKLKAVEGKVEKLEKALLKAKTPTEREALIRSASKQNGALFEFARRVEHMANYIQAGAVLRMIQFEEGGTLQDLDLLFPRSSDIKRRIGQFEKRIQDAIDAPYPPPPKTKNTSKAATQATKGATTKKAAGAAAHGKVSAPSSSRSTSKSTKGPPPKRPSAPKPTRP